MSSAGGIPAPAPRRAPLRGLIVAAFIFFLGPPIGALLLIGPGFLLSHSPSPTGMSEFPPAMQGDLDAYLGVALFVLLFSHMAGGLQALLTGIWLGLRTFWYGTFSYGEAALAALVVSAVWGLAAYGGLNEALIWSRTAGDPTPGGGLAMSFGILGIISALICRFLLRRFRILPGERQGTGLAPGKS
jgi:hypothetical protein